MNTFSRFTHDRQLDAIDDRAKAAIARFLDGVAEPDRRAIEALFRIVHAEPGQTIAREDERGGSLYVVVDGSVEIVRDGEDMRIATLGPGDDFGAAALGGLSRTATVRSVAYTRLAVLRVTDLEALATSGSGAYAALLRATLGRQLETLRETSDRFIDGLRRELEAHKARLAMSAIVTFIVGLLCTYSYLLRIASAILSLAPATTFVTSTGLLLAAVAAWAIVRRSGEPLSSYGFTLANWRRHVVESLGYTAVFLAFITLFKWSLLHVIPSMQGMPLFGSDDVRKLGPLAAAGVAALYVLFVPVQEFLARSVLQGSLERLFVGRFGTARAIVLSSLIFGATHLHLSLAFGLITLIPGVFWGALYARQHSLLGVCVSHSLVGTYAIFVLGLPGMTG